MLGPLVKPRYEDIVLDTRPVFYVPLEGSVVSELVRGVKATVAATSPTPYRGPAQHMGGYRFSDSTTDNDYFGVTTHTSYHPGDTFSVGGWFNRLANGAGDGSLLHLGTGDFVVWFNGGTLALRKAGTGDCFTITSPTFGTVPTGWHHIIFTKNGSGAGSTIVAYLNGVSVAGTYTNRTIVAAATDPRLGLTATSNNEDYGGALSHWAIWNRVLTQAEVTALYRAAIL